MQELIANIGKTAVIRLNDMDFQIKIVDVKQAYGKIRYQVTPAHFEDGSQPGKAWVMADRIAIK